jgi:DNA-binding winged helix-turn-helix (wHTH) protein
VTEHKAFVFRFEGIEVRESEFALIRAGGTVQVEPTAFRVLLYLLRNPGRLVTKDEIMAAVWHDTAVSDNSLTRSVATLRKVLDDSSREPRYIATVQTLGYRFLVPVERFPIEASDLAFALEALSDSGGLPTVAAGRERPTRWIWGRAALGALVITVVVGVWYLSRPMPPPRVTGYVQITHDGRKKSLVGTDGTRLYFNQMSGPILPESIAEVAIAGGGVAQVLVALPDPHIPDVSPDSELGKAGGNATLSAPYLLDVSPDGSSFLVGGPNNSTWNIRILGGSARRLPDAVCAAFSPDGNSVVYSMLRDATGSTPERDIWLVRKDGTDARRLASPGGDVCYLAWSPDGRAIRFSMNDKIWEMSSSGSGLHKVLSDLHGSSAECCGRWTSDGKFFLFFSEGQIWVLDERRGLFRRRPAEPIQLTQGPIRWGPPPSGKYYRWDLWAGPIPGSDGSRIFALGTLPRGEASRFDSKTEKFQPFLGGISAQGIAFSHDGKWIAYVSYPEGTLWKAKRDGSNPVQLTDPPMVAFLPRWSPDGKQILFLGDPFLNRSSAPNWVNYVVSVDGGNPRRLFLEGQDLASCTWSPDGHRIAGSLNRPDGKLALRVFDFDTGRGSDIPGSVGLFAPRWSPDGQYLAAVNKGTGEHLKIFNFKTQQWSEFSQKGVADSTEWSADSKFIYFRRTSGDLGVFRIRIHGSVAEKIADLKDWRDAGWWGRYMGLDPTDAPLMLRDIGSEDIYALTLAP